MANKSYDNEIIRRIVRLETKLVRGFEEMGIATDENENWLEIDKEKRIVHIKTLGRSLKSMTEKMKNLGANDYNNEYEIFYCNEYYGSIILR